MKTHAAHKHAATAYNGGVYAYDANGNMITRDPSGGTSYGFTYDQELCTEPVEVNRLRTVTASATANVTYNYDGVAQGDKFDGTSLPAGWWSTGQVTFSGGQMHVAGSGTWNDYARRTGTFGDGYAVRFQFKASATNAIGSLYFMTGNWGQGDYRRWGINVGGGYIYRHYYEGTSSNQVSLMALEANTWYEVVLVADANDQFRAVVWKQSDPNVRAENTATFSPSTWGGKAWMYYLQMHTGTVDVESYVEYDYGAMGQRTYMDDAPGYTKWRYDFRGRLAEEEKYIDPDTFYTRYTYNKADLMATMKYPDDEVVTFSYNRQMLLKSVVGNYDYLYDTFYDAAGRVRYQYLEWEGFNPAVQTEYKYKDWNVQGGRLDYIKSGDPGVSQSSLLDLRYNYDNVGNIVNIYDYKAGTSPSSPQTQTFGYDDLDRLTSANATGGSASESNYSQTYTYHPDTGNLYSKTGMGAYTYTSSHKHAVTHLGGVQKYWYDANGNMTTRVSGSTYNFNYDVENRLVTVSNGASATFSYDGDGARVMSVMGSTTTKFVGNHWEWTSSAVKKYYYASGQRIAMRTGTAAPQWLISNHLGSTSKVANFDGTLHSSQLYKPWGELRYPATSALPTKFQYTGQYSYAADFGLLYYNARFYDPALSRFASADTVTPAGVQGLDRYAYANNSPVKYNDPTGHCTEDDVDCLDLVDSIQEDFGITIGNRFDKNWTLQSLGHLVGALSEFRKNIGQFAFYAVFNDASIGIKELDSLYGTGTFGMWETGKLTLDPEAFQGYTSGSGKSITAQDNLKGTTIHELDHGFVDEIGLAETVYGEGGFAEIAGWYPSGRNPSNGPTTYSRTTNKAEEDLHESVMVLLVDGTKEYDLSDDRKIWIEQNLFAYQNWDKAKGLWGIP